VGVLRDMLRHWPRRLFAPAAHLRAKYEAFKGLLDADEKSLVLIAELEEIFYGGRAADPARVSWLCRRLLATVRAMTQRLVSMHPTRYQRLAETLRGLEADLDRHLAVPVPETGPPYLLELSQCLGQPERAGGKAANLAAAARAGLNVPPALVLSAQAFNLLVEENGLRPRLDRLLRQADLARPDRLASRCAALGQLILNARVPDAVAGALRAAAQNPALSGGLLAVRSSAVGEDGGLSFAGQYDSELDVPPADLAGAWLRILAAKYRPRAVAYRILHGLGDAQTPMAVLVMPMIAARAAGALFSHDTRQGGEHSVTVFALAGLADRLMAGQVLPRVLRLARSLPATVQDDSGPREAALDQDALAGLVQTALALEDCFGCPQEAEWALDQQGRLFVLQSRPHRADETAPRRPPEPGGLPDFAGPAPLASGLRRMSFGVAAGPVFPVRNLSDLSAIPKGSVLTVESLSPSLCKCIGLVAAVVAGSGCRASHFASVAREFGLPVLADAHELRERLSEGQVVTVDASAGAVFEGRVESLLAGREQGSGSLRRQSGQRFAGLIPLTCALHLTDPDSPDFSAQACRSLHDVVRFCHERAVGEMFTLSDRSGRGLHDAKRFESGLPLSLYVLDLGGGAQGVDKEALRPEDLTSIPMRAVWTGLAHAEEIWDPGGLHCDWQEFDRISAGIFRKDTKLLASYALLSDDYLHLLVRFGYHFAVLDSLCAERPEGNYITLRFKGGGGMEEQRLLRVAFIRRVLSGAGFTVRTRGDMLDARYARAGREATCKRLELLGRLLARTRLMDMRLTDPAQALDLADAFLSEVGHA